MQKTTVKILNLLSILRFKIIKTNSSYWLEKQQFLTIDMIK